MLYGPEGKIAGYADRTGSQVIWFDYDPASGLLTTIRDAQNQQITLSYDADGRLWTVKDVEQQETRYDYDAAGRLQSVFKPNGKESHLTYLLTGEVVGVQDEAGQAYWFDYDYDDRTKEYYTMIKDPEGNVKEVWYDEQGRTIRVDDNGDTKQTIEREDNALIITDAEGKVTRKEYDEWNNLTRILYPDNSEVFYEYEHRYNRLTRRVDQEGIVTRYTYDTDGNLFRKVAAEGTVDEQIRDYTYWPDGTMKTAREQDSATGNVIDITYNTRGKIDAVTDESGEWVYNYDAQGRFESLTRPDSTTYP